MKNLKILSAVVVLAAFSTVQAQDTDTDSHTITIGVPAVTIVDIEPEASKNITMGFTAPTEAGLPISSLDNAALWLNYSFIPAVADGTATITVLVDALVPGMDINVQSSTHSGTGGGTFGAPVAGTLTLTTAAQSIITSIGASYTGDGESNGHNLTYSLDVTDAADYADLYELAETVTVTYTIVPD